MTEPASAAQDTLRSDILASGHNDFVSMADVQACICDGLLAELSAERQQLVVDTVRSLLGDGLVEVGVIPSPSSPGFKTWPGTVDEGHDAFYRPLRWTLRQSTRVAVHDLAQPHR
jgi:hypothetical protein